jgi:3,4-dihydroxy 2-butanone 4-phosphate synthase / GTP cyclohydrolase II
MGPSVWQQNNMSNNLQSNISNITDIIDELRRGNMVILVDEEDRENEGDLVMAAEFVTPAAINFMAKYGRGLICLTLTKQQCEALQLPLMVNANGSSHGTNFTLSIEAAEGVTTGISAADRALTIQKAVARNAKPSDIVQPGHIFPLMAQAGGVLMRAGHTEAGCDLTALAGLTPASVICEIMNDDGTMARLPDLIEFAKQHQLKIGTIADLIQYRSERECLVKQIGQRTLQTPQGPFTAVLFEDTPSKRHHLALVKYADTPNKTFAELDSSQEIVVRVHEPLSLLDLLETQQTSHSWPLSAALQRIQHSKQGVAVLLNIDQSSDNNSEWLNWFSNADDANSENQTPKTIQPHHNKMDLRTYGIGSQILRQLGVRKMRLLGNPRKMPSMTGFDLQVTEFETYCHP